MFIFMFGVVGRAPVAWHWLLRTMPLLERLLLLL